MLIKLKRVSDIFEIRIFDKIKIQFGVNNVR